MIGQGKKITGLILSGGLSRRMGNDKAEKKIFEKKLLDIVIKRVELQVDHLIINSKNKSLRKNYIIIPDCIPGHLGPLVGILSGLKWLKKNSEKNKWLNIFPVDSPFFPSNLVESFFNNLSDEKILIAECKGRSHPVFSMWHLDVLNKLEEFLLKGGRKIDVFTKNFKTGLVNFPFIGYDPFFNINNKEDLKEAEKIYRSFDFK